MSLKKIRVNNTQTVEVLDDVVKTSKELVNSDGIWNHTRTEVASQISEMQPIIYEGDVTNAPDEEDLTSVNNQLKLKDRSTTWGMGRKILRKNIVDGVNTLTQSMMQATNTIYVIQYDFILGEDITVPDNCMLEFDGGSISASGSYDNITFNNTKIVNGNLNGITPLGTIDGIVDVSWFGLKKDDNTFDNGAIINAVANVFKSIYIPKGEYYFSTPIYINAPELIEFDCQLSYNLNEDASALTIENGYSANINIRTVVNKKDVGYRTDNRTHRNGVEIINCNNCNINIGTISAFNDGLVLNGKGDGCSYNQIYFQNIFLANRHIYGTFSTVNNVTGWINQNIIYGGRISTDLSYFDDFNDVWGIKIDGLDNLTIIGTSIETKNGIWLSNSKDVRIYNTRHEGNLIALKEDNNTRYIDFKPGFGTKAIECSNNGYRCYDVKSNSPIVSIPMTSEYTEIDVSMIKHFSVCSNSADHFIIKGVERNGQPILETEADLAIFPGGLWDCVYGPNQDLGYATYSDITVHGVYQIPQDITKIKIKATTSLGHPVCNLYEYK